VYSLARGDLHHIVFPKGYGGPDGQTNFVAGLSRCRIIAFEDTIPWILPSVPLVSDALPYRLICPGSFLDLSALSRQSAGDLANCREAELRLLP
jgi:hypothetical protein